MWTPSLKQFLCSRLSSTILEHIIRRASLGDLVLDPSLLSLYQSAMFTCQGRFVSDQEVGDFIHGLIVLINCLSAAV